MDHVRARLATLNCGLSHGRVGGDDTCVGQIVDGVETKC